MIENLGKYSTIFTLLKSIVFTDESTRLMERRVPSTPNDIHIDLPVSMLQTFEKFP